MGVKRLTRLEKRAIALPAFLCDDESPPTLPEICMKLHMRLNGAAYESMSAEEVTDTVKYLRICLKTWEKTRNRNWLRFDELVREMIRIILVEMSRVIRFKQKR